MPLLYLARRRFLGQMTTGLAGVVLSRLLVRGLVAAGGVPRTHFAPKSKQVLQFFSGGASHLDLWDH